MAVKKKTPGDNPEAIALAKTEKKLNQVSAQNAELTSLVEDLANVDPQDPALARRQANTARATGTGARLIGSGLGGAMFEFGFVGKVVAVVVGLAGAGAEMLGAGDGKGAGRRAVNVGSGVANGAVGAAAASGVRALREKKQEKEGI